MDNNIPTREQAWTLLTQYNNQKALLKHALAVEAVMRYMARLWEEDEDVWGVVGLVHDLDYEQYPDQHCQKTEELLHSAGWPEELIRAVLSHGWGKCTDVEPQTRMEKMLCAVDELTGLVAATALVRPSKSIHDVKVKSVKKKWKEKAFAAGVDRQIIQQGADMLGMELSELIEHTIAGMQEVAQALGLAGDTSAS